MNRKRIYTGAAVFLLLLFTACDMTGPEPGPIPDPPEGKAAVLVRIESAGIPGRTVAPDVAVEAVTSWELRGGKQGEAESQLAVFSGAAGAATVYLEPGVWHFTLKGSKEGGGVILTGTIPEQDIVLGGTNILDFTLFPVSDGQGTIRITINLPEGSGITRARIFMNEMELEPSAGSPVTPVNNQILFERAYPAGDYYFSFRLYNGNDLYGVISEIVQVRANLQSEKTYILTLEDLDRTYIITYHLMDEETETAFYRYTSLDVPLPEASRPNYGFEGWYDNPDWSGDAVTVVPTGSVGDKNFYARWSVVQYTVTFDADEGSPATKTRTVNSGDSVGSPLPITTITYSSVSGGLWTGLDDGRGQSPPIGDADVTKARISFTSTVDNASITIQLAVSSEAGYDFAFISTLDNGSASFNTGYYDGSRISGTESVAVTIPVPTTGSHFIDIGYRKDGSGSGGSDCAWFEVTDAGGWPSDPTKTGYAFGGWYTEPNGGGSPFIADTTVNRDITVYARWTLGASVQIALQPVAADPPLANTTLSASGEALFSAERGYDSDSYTWYWDGMVIEGANTSAYTLEPNAKESGIYELSVVVTTDTGEWLSARCRVTINGQ